MALFGKTVEVQVQQDRMHGDSVRSKCCTDVVASQARPHFDGARTLFAMWIVLRAQPSLHSQAERFAQFSLQVPSHGSAGTYFLLGCYARECRAQFERLSVGNVVPHTSCLQGIGNMSVMSFV